MWYKSGLCLHNKRHMVRPHEGKLTIRSMDGKEVPATEYVCEDCGKHIILPARIDQPTTAIPPKPETPGE